MDKKTIKEKIKKVLMELHSLLGGIEDDIENNKPTIIANNIVMFPKNKINKTVKTSNQKGIVIPFPCKSSDFNSDATLETKEQEELKYKDISIIKHKTCNTW